MQELLTMTSASGRYFLARRHCLLLPHVLPCVQAPVLTLPNVLHVSSCEHAVSTEGDLTHPSPMYHTLDQQKAVDQYQST